MSRRIYQYPEVTELQEGDVMLIDKEGNETAKSILASKVAPALMSKTITERGVYKASDDGVRGYNEVNVEIPYTDVHVASGPIATFEGEDLPLKSLTASIVPVQAGSGDPSPTNVRPITGWTEEVVSVCGKNWFNIGTVANWGYSSGVDLAISNNTLTYKIVADGLTMATNTNPIYKKGNVNISFTASKTYSRVLIKLRKLDDSGWMTNADASIQGLTYNSFYGGWFVDNTTTDVSRSVNIPSCKYWVLGLGYNNTSVVVGEYETISNVQVENGTTKTEYREYNGTTTTIPFTDGQGQSVEVFGGSVDVVNGSLTDDSKFYEDLSDITFELSANGLYYWSRSTTIPYALNLTDGKCSHFKFGSSNDVWCGINDSTGRYILFIKANVDSALGISSVAEFNTWLASQSTNGTPVQLWYKLATPNAPIQQQPTSIKSLDGENNVFASTGDVDVEYQTVWVRPTE